MKLKVKYIDGTTDEITLYTEKPLSQLLPFLWGVAYYAALGEVNASKATRLRVKLNETK